MHTHLHASCTLCSQTELAFDHSMEQGRGSTAGTVPDESSTLAHCAALGNLRSQLPTDLQLGVQLATPTCVLLSLGPQARNPSQMAESSQPAASSQTADGGYKQWAGTTQKKAEEMVDYACKRNPTVVFMLKKLEEASRALVWERIGKEERACA